MTDATKPAGDLVMMLRENSGGRDEWRVQDPENGAYCISFDRSDSSNPKREATEWLADHRKNGYRYSHYEVKCVRVQSFAEKLMREAADEIDRLTAALADRERAIAEAVPDVWLVKVSRLVQGFEHVSGIARLWEPDHSTGSERALWARATEACADVAKLLHDARSGAKG